MKVGAALAEATVRLNSGGIADPGRDARLLLAHAMRIAPDRVRILDFEDLSPEGTAEFQAMISARLQRMPVAMLIGEREFWGRSFAVTRDTLVPRPETETLVETSLKAPFIRLLDLGTGSGVLAITLLAERPEATGVASDTSAAALKVAQRNARAHGVSDRLKMLRADWFDGIEGAFDLIVSNPPYIAEAELTDLAPEVRDWDPRQALTPGGDGLDAYRAIFAAVGPHLAPNARILLEIGATQAAAVRAIAAAAGFSDTAIAHDLDGRDRVIIAQLP